jgi:hypothetical protein
MGRPCIGDRPMTVAERSRRYRRRKRLCDVQPITFRPVAAPVTKLSPPATKPFDAPFRSPTVGAWRVSGPSGPWDAGNKPNAAPGAPVAARRIDVKALIG